ncbi:MAG: putative metal-binding protein [Longimicrobiaceae bacterium]
MQPDIPDASVPGTQPVPAPGEDAGIHAQPGEAAHSAVSPAPQLPEPLVDPAVSRAKFDRQVADYRSMEREYLRRGWMMVRAEFPEVAVVFAAPHLQPRGVLFGVVVDFTNYDLWAPSVRFVDPFTLEPLRIQEMAGHPILKRPRPSIPVNVVQAAVGDVHPGGAAAMPVHPGGPGVQVHFQAPPQNLLLSHEDGKPFLCVAGVREYHEHPFHSNDPWLAHRMTGAGSLYHILNVIYRHGVVPLHSWDYQVSVQYTGHPLIDLNQLPE